MPLLPPVTRATDPVRFAVIMSVFLRVVIRPPS
jgi:hypothetical protein